MSFDQNGDAAIAVAIQDALTEIAEGEGQRVVDMIDKAKLRLRGARNCIAMLAELGRPRRRHFVCVPASKIWTPTEDQTIPPLAVAKIG